MKMTKIILIAFVFITAALNTAAQTIKFEGREFDIANVKVSVVKLNGEKVLRVERNLNSLPFDVNNLSATVDEPTFVKLKNITLDSAIIEVKVLSRLLKNAPDFARGFIGVAFRISDSNTKYESIYIRPINVRVDDQVRRNHSIQYYSYPDYKFDRLRKESPERYESYADMEMNKWITMRIEVKDAQAKLFLDNNKQPSLIVNDLKHGADLSGAIALWVDIGTEGYFKDLKITKY